MKILLLILFIGLVFLSCKKERSIHITAKNAATGEGYVGLGFILRETKEVITSLILSLAIWHHKIYTSYI